MAELSNMPLLDENKNTSTLNNCIPESDDFLLSSTNDEVKNITSENAYQSPTLVKGNFSEINSNINVLSPKNLNILSPETGGGNFLKSEIANGSLLEKSVHSFNTANESLLEETNSSFKSLNGSYLEAVKSPNCSVKSSLDETLTKVEAPPHCPSPNANLEHENSSNVNNSLNDANKCASFTEFAKDVSVTSSLPTSSLIASPMGNNPSSDESKPVSSVKNTSTVKEPSTNQASLNEEKSNTPIKSVATPTVESPAVQTSFTGEKPDTSSKSFLNTTATIESSPISLNFEEPKSLVESVLDTKSTVESPVNQTSANITDSSVKILLDESTVKMAPVDQTFTEDKLDSSVKSLLDATSTVEMAPVNQATIAEEKLDSSVKSLLDTTSTVEVTPVDQTSFTEDKSDYSVQSLLNTTSTIGMSPVEHSSLTAKSDSHIKSLLDTTSTVEVTPVDQASFTENKYDSSVQSLLNTTSTIGMSPVEHSSLTAKSDSRIKSLLDTTSTVEVNPVDQISFTENKSDSSFQSHLNTTSTIRLSPVEQSSLTAKSDSHIKSLLDTTSSVELPSVNHPPFTGDKADTSVMSLPDTISTIKSPLPDSCANVCLQGDIGNAEADVSLDNKSASFSIDTALSDSSLSKPIVKNTSNEDSSRSSDKGLSPFVNSDSSSNLSQLQTTPKNTGKLRETSRLIEFSMIKDESILEEFQFKVPMIKVDSASTPNEINTNVQIIPQQSEVPIHNSVTDIPEAFDGGLQDISGDKITVTGEDPFGMCKSDPFSSIDKTKSQSDNLVFKVPENPANVENEDFTDAVQFFKDPTSFQFLENIKTSQSIADVPRSSLYIKFDPLHSTVSSQKNLDGDILQALKNEANIDPNKQLNMSARESLGNILISFDSPRFDCQDVPTPVRMAPVKAYTEEELQQHLKVNELTNQEILLKKQREMEKEASRKEQEMMARAEEKDAKISKIENLLRAQSKLLQEFALTASTLTEGNKDVHKKMAEIEEENTKLKGDVKTLTDDLQSVETTFSDFHKRYEQCKGMLKTYKDNEDILRTKLKEQEEAYHDLQSRTQEASDKTNSEIASVKKASEGQIAVLRAQLKKAELKISSLESDINKIKIENSQLGGLCDDLMEKVGKS